MADRTESIILDVEIDAQESVESINSLLEANKRLRKERNDLHIQTEAGAKRAKEINALIDANTNKIKENVSALEKQKINIGNYKSALDGISPALGKVAEGAESAVNGLKGMSLAAKAFIMTGIGAIIAAVGLAFGALMKYLQGSEEGQNRLNRIVAIGSAIFEQLMNVVEAVGEAVYNAIKNPQQAIKDFGKLVVDQIVNRFMGMLELIPNIGRAIGLLFQGKFAEAGKVAADAVGKVTLGIENATDKINNLIDETGKAIQTGIDYGNKISALNAKIDKEERKLIEDRAKSNLEVSKLRQQAVELEGEEKIKAIKQAIAIEEQLASRELALAKDRLALTELQIEANGDDKEALNERAEAVAKVSQAEQMAFDNTLKFRKELDNLNKEAAKLNQQRIADAEALRRAQSGSAISETEDDPIVKAELDRAIQVKDINERLAKDLARIRQQEIDRQILAKAKQLETEKIIEEQKYDAAVSVARGIMSVLDEQSEAYKAIATAQVLISTYSAATKAYEAAFLPIPTVASPAIGAAFAAAAVLQGLSNVARINGIEFAEGGWTGPGEKWDAVGIVHADEYVTPKRVVNNPMAQPHLAALERMRLAPYADGGMVTRSISAPINQAFEMANVIKNLPAPVVSVKEFAKVEKQVEVKQNISKI